MRQPPKGLGPKAPEMQLSDAATARLPAVTGPLMFADRVSLQRRLTRRTALRVGMCASLRERQASSVAPCGMQLQRLQSLLG